VTAAARGRSVGMTVRLRYLAPILLAGLLAAPAVDAKPRTNTMTRLHAFESCRGLVAYAHRHGVRVINDMRPFPVRGPMPVTGGPTPPAADAPSAGGGAGREGATSPTNVQEAGVDEPDRVKAAGSMVYAFSGDRLQAIDASGSQPRMLGSVELPGYGHELLVQGDRALVIATRSFGGGGPIPIAVDQVASAAIAPPRRWLSSTTLTELDLSDPGAPRVLRTLDVEGAYVSARLAAGVARVVVTTEPRGLIMPASTAGPWPKVRKTWRRSVRRARTPRWLPAMVLRDRRTGATKRSALVRCRSVRRPRVFSGLDTINVLTIDMKQGLPAVDVDSVMSDGETVYASPDRLYVASQRWLGDDPTRAEVDNLALTAVHAFDTTKPGETSYVGSGEVPGYMLNQWAMSERGGVLRIATTSEPPWEDSERKTHSAVRTLEERDGRLVQIGAVGGLGEGERIFAVRFIEDTAYVVTFRQTDPLFTIDLSNPRAPRKVGELHVNGYSAYLHPVGDGLLLGLGRDADAQGNTRGLQLSLFDVSDLAHPVRLARRTLDEDFYSEAEGDHHAFLWWAPEHLAVIPVESFAGGGGFGGAMGFRVTATAIAPGLHIPHPSEEGNDEYVPAFRRAVVVGDRLVLVSDSGVASTPVAAPAPAPFVSFP
jgi:hypothetical protein